MEGKNPPRGYCSVCPRSSYGENDPPYQLPRGVFRVVVLKFNGIGTRTGCGGVMEIKSGVLFWQNYYQVQSEGDYKVGFPFPKNLI